MHNQFRIAFESGIEISHFDSHQHVHNFVEVMKSCLKAATLYKISKCRLNSTILISSEDEQVSPISLWPRHITRLPKTFLGNIYKLYSKQYLLKSNFKSPKGIIYPLPFIDMKAQVKNKEWEKVYSRIPYGIYEQNCHPGLFEGECDFFSDSAVLDIIKHHHIELISFKQI